jgi:hypothetical protein
MDLVLIGTFKRQDSAQAALRQFDDLRALSEEEGIDDNWGTPDEWMPDPLYKRLEGLNLHNFGRADVDTFSLDHRTELDGTVLKVFTDESEIQGVLKLLLRHGAQIQIFSRHDWEDPNTPAPPHGG